jgi:hypothetical protein
VLTVVTAFGLKRSALRATYRSSTAFPLQTRRDDALIQSTWGNALGFTMVVSRGATPEAALAQNDLVSKALAREANVASVFSLSSICPAPETQSANVKRWSGFWTPARRASVRATLDQAGTELGYRAGAFAKFWQIVESDPSFITLDSFRGTPWKMHSASAWPPGWTARP